MISVRWLAPFALLLAAALLPGPAGAAPRAAEAGKARVAVASNFIAAARAIARAFEAAGGRPVQLVAGSTGRLYAQIVNGAPFDAFLAADTARPMRLEQQGMALPGSRFTYAVGTLVLWSPDPGLIDAEGAVLKRAGFRHLAMANPKLAPYGRAARQVLRKTGLWPALKTRIVRGENIGQTYQLIRSGNAELGFIALSQLRGGTRPPGGSAWVVPSALHDPIAQQAVLLNDNAPARAFLAFLRGAEARDILQRFGYTMP